MINIIDEQERLVGSVIPINHTTWINTGKVKYGFGVVHECGWDSIRYSNDGSGRIISVMPAGRLGYVYRVKPIKEGCN